MKLDKNTHTRLPLGILALATAVPLLLSSCSNRYYGCDVGGRVDERTATWFRGSWYDGHHQGSKDGSVAWNADAHRYDHPHPSYFHGGYREGYDVASNPSPGQTQSEAFNLGEEKGRCDRRCGRAPNHSRYSSCVAPCNQSEFARAYAIGYKLEGRIASL